MPPSFPFLARAGCSMGLRHGVCECQDEEARKQGRKLSSARKSPRGHGIIKSLASVIVIDVPSGDERSSAPKINY